MQLEEAQLLISRVLDGEADANEKQALDEAIRDQPEIANLFEAESLEHRGLEQLVALRQETLLDQNDLEDAFERLALRAKAEAQTLRSLEPGRGRVAGDQSGLAARIARLFPPLPSLTGALAGAVAGLTGVFLMSTPQLASGPGQLTPGPPTLVAQDQPPAGFGPTRGGGNTRALSEVVAQMTSKLEGPAADPAAAVALGQQFEREHPGAADACTCDSWSFHYAMATAGFGTGDDSGAGKAMVRAGLCLQQNPCPARQAPTVEAQAKPSP